MKLTLTLLALTLTTLFSCQKVKNETIVVTNGDTLNSEYLIRDSQIGPIRKGMSKNRLYDFYGQDNVKLLRNDETKNSDDSLGVYNRYFVYDNNQELLFIARVNQKKNYIDRIVIKNNDFKTEENINQNSTIKELREAYKELTVIENNGMVFITIPFKDIYFGIDPNNVKGFTNMFEADISIDSIDMNAKPISMTINWTMDESDVLSLRYWKERLDVAIIWTVVELPSIILIIAIFIGALKLNNFLCKRLRKLMLRNAERNEQTDTEEASKRITTITKIFHQLISIVFWVIFVFALLSKFNINLGPIIAGAGIFGLAIGFGSQELVRDFISGFFMLLEDQIRTGDMAIINGTTGKVEKIALRTVTLRDTAGVVHTFQNGKINTLSNMTKEWSAIVLEIGVAYKENIDNVMELMKEVGIEMANNEEFSDKMLNTVEVLGLDQFGDSAIIIKAMIKTRPMQQWAIKREYQRRLKIAFDNNNIEIPFPHIAIYTGEATKSFPINIEK